MKAVSLNKLPMRKLGKSIWMQEAPEGSGITVDYELLEHMFVDQAKIKEQEKSVAGAKSEAAAKVDDKVKFLDPKRSQNISIIASSIKASAAQLRTALEAADLAVLSADVVDRLMSLCPIAKSELASCREFSGDVEKLDRAERYLYELSQIGSLEGRLRCLHLQQHFGEWRAHCADSMSLLVRAASEISQSTALPCLLRYILAAANYLNSGTLASHRKNARGVKLDFLLELQKTTTRGNPKIKKIITFLQLVQLQVGEHSEEADGWLEQLPSLDSACSVDLPSVSQVCSRPRNHSAGRLHIHELNRLNRCWYFRRTWIGSRKAPRSWPRTCAPSSRPSRRPRRPRRAGRRSRRLWVG